MGIAIPPDGGPKDHGIFSLQFTYVVSALLREEFHRCRDLKEVALDSCSTGEYGAVEGYLQGPDGTPQNLLAFYGDGKYGVGPERIIASRAKHSSSTWHENKETGSYQIYHCGKVV